jgi:hypothetical protein
MTAFLAVQSAVMGALLASPPVADGRIWENRRRPIQASHPTAVVVRLDASDGEQVLAGVGAPMRWTTSVAVECYARASAAAAPAESVDALLSEVWRRIVTADLSSAGVLTMDVKPQIEWQFDEGDTPAVCAVVRLVVLHQTDFETLSTT